MSGNVKIRFSFAILVCIAIIALIGLYYSVEVNKISHTDGQSAEVIPDKSVETPVPTEDMSQPKQLPDRTDQAKTASGLELPKLEEKTPQQAAIDAERRRREGYMWVDRVTDKYVVTLGSINGVKPGRYLSVYDNDIRIGKVMVVTSYEEISYVEPPDDVKPKITKDYYQVYND